MVPVVELKESGFLSCPRRRMINKRWRDEWLGELKKTREVDKDFRRQINEDKFYTCEKHFKDEEIEICKYFLINRACISVTINIAFEARASALCCTIRC